ncbi:hypothetical protein PLESTM_000150500 [Pleodorina starrii]|nr:hypothetical protein PLESTM_000150500 [Pleodorina starrii]
MRRANIPPTSALSRPSTSSSNGTLSTVQDWSRFFTHGAVASNANGERAMYLAGKQRSDDVCIFLDVALDNSGSMDMNCGGGKSRLAVSLECIQSIARDPTLNLQEPDSFVLRTFNGYILERFCTHPDRFDYDKMLRNIQHKPGDTGKTRVWDAMGKTLSVMLEHPEKRRAGKEVIRFMLVLTDGGDNASNDSVAAIGQKLVDASKRLANMHVVVIAAGLDGSALKDLERLTQLCNGKLGFRVITAATASDVDIKKAFAEAMDEIRALLLRDKNGNLQITTLRTRNAQLVQRSDAMAALAMQRYETSRTITSGDSNEMRSLIALMSSTSVRN